ncbi:lytic transglycosylase domain-containing protein [Acidisphaera sp. L21]|uniref:lytic murein transglycosylase n=1 Tax=Acidisphaera sp. L21 TaxID=1641851 RepID=UPI00131B5FF4|nr:lytic murein transglycosylase [Acidisphaera sp. L21]
MISRRSFTATALPIMLAAAARAETPFAAFLADVRAEAIAGGITPATVDRAFAGLRPNAKVLALDSHQPEVTQSWERYRASRLSDQRVVAGRKAMQANRGTLTEINRRYGVDPGVIVAIWGVETSFGGFTGGFSVIEALATLAADGRHNGFFRTELVSALHILDSGDITLSRMTGSYAGAMGQPQFMPSSYLAYAVDFDGTGRRDIWGTRNDVLASIANYLAKSGWRPGEPWGQPIRVPNGFAVDRNGRDDRRPLAAWSQLGITRLDGSAFSQPNVLGAVVMPDGAGGEAFMTYANFGVIRVYNPSDLYALSVGLLASQISG